jgi:hypothetical protein
VFPARYELNSYIVFRKRLVSRRLRRLSEHKSCGRSRTNEQKKMNSFSFHQTPYIPQGDEDSRNLAYNLK